MAEPNQYEQLLLRQMNAAATPSRGLGDVVAAALARVGVKPCAGCEKRKELLNQLGEQVVRLVNGGAR